MRTRVMSEEEAGHFLVRYAPTIDAWHKRFEEGPPPAQPGSPMRADDQASDPYQLSHVVWLALSHSADSLHTFRMATIAGSDTEFNVTTRPYGSYANLRAGLENAATALYLLGPPSRNERLTRRYRLWVQDGRHMDKLSLVLRNRPPATKASERINDLTPLAAKRGLDMNTIKKSLGYCEIVRGAAPFAQDQPDHGEAMWRILSGMTHGDTWATLNIIEKEEMSRELSDGTVNLRLTSPVDRVAGFAAVVGNYLGHGFRLYDLRCMSATG